MSRGLIASQEGSADSLESNSIGTKAAEQREATEGHLAVASSRLTTQKQTPSPKPVPRPRTSSDGKTVKF